MDTKQASDELTRRYIGEDNPRHARTLKRIDEIMHKASRDALEQLSKQLAPSCESE